MAKKKSVHYVDNKKFLQAMIDWRETWPDEENIPPHYDSLIGKLIVHADDRLTAINRMQRALEEIILEGPKTTIPFHQAIMKDKTFQGGDFNTSFIDSFSYT